MKRVLILGAGLVARPLVRYLLDLPELQIVAASRTGAKARELVGDHPRGGCVALNVDDEDALGRLVGGVDLVVSLLPYIYHVRVARHCLRHRKHLVTTSYVSSQMQELDSEARAAGVLLLNEIGLDPGIDHMSAMRVIHRVQQEGGVIAEFLSYCGGLPAPEANDNPLGYKFSWSPRGVLMAGRNDARYLKDCSEVFVSSRELFSHRWRVTVDKGYEFEAYPNRNSMPYIPLYGISGVRSMLRGTLRNPGWCETLQAIADLGLLADDTMRTDLGSFTVAEWLRAYVPGTGALRDDTAAKLGLPCEHPVLEKLSWLGLFDERRLSIEQGTALDVLAALMTERMSYRPGERDMIVLHHEFLAEYPDSRRQRILSTLIDFGFPHGDTAMARTVSLPAAIAVRLILEGRVEISGVAIPLTPELYVPVLEELDGLGIVCREQILPA